MVAVCEYCIVYIAIFYSAPVSEAVVANNPTDIFLDVWS